MSSPYINTHLMTKVSIEPIKMDNNIRNHIKSNLERRVMNKCFSHYGFIMGIHEISYNSDAIISPEDPSTAAIYNVKFLCTLCHPLNNSMIIGEIKNINSMVIQVVNGPLNIIINTTRSINNNIFKFNNKLRLWTIKEENNTSEDNKKYMVLKPGMYVKVKILSKKIVDKSDKILCLGYLDSVASVEEAENNIKQLYGNKDVNRDNIIDNIEEYINQDNIVNDEDKQDED